ncbi:MAG: SgcJ/EcaC family oxidoreductase [Acidobacteria bacterium]|nr:SgcJ/EcaC family oxidoreductase [Acidobacteriota bacterium]
MEKLFLVLATVLVLAASGCGPQVDVEAEEAAIRAAEDEALKIAQAKDAERWASVYADDARVFPPNALLVTGKEAIRKLFAELFASPGFEIDWEVTRVEVSRAGDLGYVVGTHKVTVNDAEGNPVTDRGKWIAIWKKQADGTWKCIEDIWNSDQPTGGGNTE